MQNIIALTIVFSASAYVLYSLYKSLKTKKMSKCDGCSGCAFKSTVKHDSTKTYKLSY